MATTFTGTLKISINGALENTADIGGPARYPITWSKTTEYTNGGGSSQANMVWSDTATIAASSTSDIDLGALTNAFGNAIVFTKIKAIIISAAAGNTNNLLVGGDASAAFATMFGNANDEIVIRPGGTLLLEAKDATGYAVTADTGDILEITNSGGTTGVTYDIILVGAVA